MSLLTILDGPLGTELVRRGVPTDGPAWSATANTVAPHMVAAIHAEYAAAGATVHTANTFRTQQRVLGEIWREAATRAVELARTSIPSHHRVAGSIAPLEDCYRPELSPGADAYYEHRMMAETLAAAGCDLLLCETHPNGDEAQAAVEAAVETGVETWLALTAGPDATLMSPLQMAATAKEAVDRGASAILVNCTPALVTLGYVRALVDAQLGVPIGAYANAGRNQDGLGWDASPKESAKAYVELARRWAEAGATLLGGCCGTGPEHIRALSALA